MRFRNRTIPFRVYEGDRDRLLARPESVLAVDPIGEINAFGGTPWLKNSSLDMGTTGSGSVGQYGNGVLQYQSGTIIRREFNQSTSGYAGIAVETGALTQRLWNTDTMTTGWVATSLTVSSINAVGPDGLTSAVTLTTSATPATLTFSRGVTSPGTKRFSVWMRRVAGSGTVEIAANTASYTTVTVTSSWQRFYVSASVDINVGIRISSTPSHIQQIIEVYAPTAYVGSATRGPEIINPTGADLTRSNDISQIARSYSNWKTEGTIVVEACPQRGVQYQSTELAELNLAKVSAGTDYCYLALKWSAASSHDLYFTDGLFGEYNNLASDVTYVPIKRVALSWNTSQIICSINGSTPQIASTAGWNAILNQPWDLTGQGCAIRYCSVYDKAFDNESVSHLSRLST